VEKTDGWFVLRGSRSGEILTFFALALEVEVVSKRPEAGAGSKQVEVLIQQILDFIVEADVFNDAAVNAYEVVVVR